MNGLSISQTNKYTVTQQMYNTPVPRQQHNAFHSPRRAW